MIELNASDKTINFNALVTIKYHLLLIESINHIIESLHAGTPALWPQLNLLQYDVPVNSSKLKIV